MLVDLLIRTAETMAMCENGKIEETKTVIRVPNSTWASRGSMSPGPPEEDIRVRWGISMLRGLEQLGQDQAHTGPA